MIAQIAFRNLAYHWRGNFAVFLAIVVSAAVLTGALFVGDSLRGSLANHAQRQLSGVTAAYTGARLLDDRLASKLDVTPALILRGTARGPEGNARVTVIGLDDEGRRKFDLPIMQGWAENNNSAATSFNLADRIGISLRDGRSRLSLSVPQMSTVPRSSLLGRRNLDDLTMNLTLDVRVVSTGPAMDFTLTPSPEPPLNLFVPLKYLQDRLGKPNHVNAFFSFGGSAEELNNQLANRLVPADWGLKVAAAPARNAYVSVESDQLLLNPPVVAAVEAAVKDLSLRSDRTTVYLANWISSSDRDRIPYSIVAALDLAAAAPLGPFLPTGVTNLQDDEIVLTDWPESPLKNTPVGAVLTLTYFKPEVESGAVETSQTFKLVGRIPLDGAARDPDLTPPFPGITDKLRIGDWNPPFPFEASRIKAGDANEQYWNKYKTTPKAYISRAAGEKLFASRFGSVTSIRLAPANGEDPRQTAERLSGQIRSTLNAKSLGIQFDDTASRLAAASVGGTDFGGLFLGFSFFLILAALGLVGLFIRLVVDRRAKDIGALLALGYTPGQVRRVLLLEALVITIIGAIVGVLLAELYARGLIFALTKLWPDGSVGAVLKSFISLKSAAIGGAATIAMSMMAIAYALRGLVRRPIPLLLRGRTDAVDAMSATRHRRRLMLAAAIGAITVALATLAFGPSLNNPDFRAMAFFSGGGLLFLASLILIRRWLTADHSTSQTSSGLWRLGMRNAGRFPGRSTLTIFLLGSATFLLVAVESFRRRPDADFNAKSGGSGGYNLLAQADVPIFNPFDREPGRGEFLDLFLKESQNRNSNSSSAETTAEAEQTLATITRMVPLRRHAGDDASCLNLYQALQPRLLGVPANLEGFKFSMTEAVTAEEKANPWLLLVKPRDDGAIPVIGEQNSVMWMLKKGVGDVIELPDDSGSLKKFRIVALLQDSVFQSELLIGDAAFQKLFPRDEGFSEFLIDVPPTTESALRKLLESGLASHGMMVTASRERVASFQAIVGTYLTTFQLLGGLGLLLGVLGLAAVVLRGVWDRLSEFALLQAIGYSPKDIRTLVIAENLLLLMLGLGLGLTTAVISVLPQGGELIAQLPRIALLIAVVLVVGILVVIMATRSALRTPILTALRQE